MKLTGVLVIAVFLLINGLGSVAEAYQQYYDIAQLEQAQTEAGQRHLPMAWLGSLPANSNTGDSKALATQTALTILQNQAVVILLDSEKMATVPKVVRTEFEKVDDGPQLKGPSWVSPKVVFTDPEVTKAIGRVSYTQMSGEGTDIAINSALQIIRNTKDALEPAQPAVVATNETAPSRDYTPPPRDHSINYLVIIIGVPLAWYIYSRGRERDAGKK